LTRYTIGIDLGQTSDFTAFAVLEESKLLHYDLRHIERHRNEPYPAIVERTRTLVSELGGRVSLAVDATGVGRPVVDMLEEAWIPADLYAVTLTGGDAVQRKGHDYHVPKRDVVSSVACVLQTGRLRIPRSLPEASVLERELVRFRAKITLSGHDTYEAWREADHDDLVLAVSLACWLNEKGRDGWLMLAHELEDRRKAERS
jgi:hypothetical protein